MRRLGNISPSFLGVKGGLDYVEKILTEIGFLLCVLRFHGFALVDVLRIFSTPFRWTKTCFNLVNIWLVLGRTKIFGSTNESCKILLHVAKKSEVSSSYFHNKSWTLLIYHNIKTLNADENRQSKKDPVGEVKGQPFAQFSLMNKFCKAGKQCIGSSLSKMFLDWIGKIRCEISKHRWESVGSHLNGNFFGPFFLSVSTSSHPGCQDTTISATLYFGN